MTAPRSGHPADLTRRRRSSIADVAALAGVSQGTVSNVLNHPERVAEATRERVARAVTLLGFTPHGPARSLAVGSMPALGLILSDLTNSLFVDVARGVELSAARRGLMVLMANSDSDLARERLYLDAFETARTRGMIVTINEERHYHDLAARPHGDRPLVFLNYVGDGADYCSVHTDNRLGGALAAQHLVDIGRRRLALVGGPAQLQPVTERCRGFIDAVRSSPAEITVTHDAQELTRADGWRVGGELAPRIERGEVDGIFAVADLVAAGLAQAITASTSVRIPSDVAIIGYDDNRAAWDSPLPLTTISQPGEDMGATGAQLLFEEIDDPDHRHRVVELPPRLVVRQSTDVST